MSSPQYSSMDCAGIVFSLILCQNRSSCILGGVDSDTDYLYKLCRMVDGINSGDAYSKPMVFIGLYIAIASSLCIAAMMADLLHGFRKGKIWFPCKYFSLNAASITVIAVAMKLPVDLSSPMPGTLDQATKLGSMAFMCTMMANLMPSLASMDNDSLLANFIGLVILVITMIVNICIEINTGVIGNTIHYRRKYLIDEKYNFVKVASTYVAMMLVLLIILTSSAITIPVTKQILEVKYRAINKTVLNDNHPQYTSTLEKLRQLVKRSWVMVETSSPQFVMANSPLSFACGLICVLLIVINLSVLWELIVVHHIFMDCRSDYTWSMLAIYITQFIGVMVSSITPIFRCFTVLNFQLFTKSNINYLMDLKVENYWTRMLCEWKESQIPFLSSGLRSRTLAHKLKSLVISLCIELQKIIVVSCKIIRLIPIVVLICFVYCSSCWKSLKEMFYTTPNASKNDDRNEDLHNYVLQLEDEMRFSEKTLQGISNSIDSLIQKAEKEEHNNLLKFLKNSNGFNGVAHFDMDHIEPLFSVELPNIWSLPVVTLTCIAIALPNIQKSIVNSLFKSVGEGLVYAHLIEESLNSASEYVNIQRAAMTLWNEVEDKHKWLENTLDRNIFIGKTSSEIVKWFAEKAKETVMEIKRSINEEQVENFPSKLIAANSMYRISQTLLLNYRSNIELITTEELFALLHGMIADILVACFTNIPRVIALKCDESVIEKREASVEAAAKLFGRTTKIINRLEERKLPNMDPNNLAFIDEWRLHLKQSIV